MNVFEQIIEKNVAAFKNAITLDIRALLMEGIVPGTAPTKPVKQAKRADVHAVHEALTLARTEKKPRKQRSPNLDTDGAMNDLLAIIGKKPGMRSEDIIRESGLAKELVVKTLKVGSKDGKFRKEGATRNTTYFVGNGVSVATPSTKNLESTTDLGADDDEHDSKISAAE